jgi:ABC-2 type transport system permease protein
MSSTITTQSREPAPPPGWKQGDGPSLVRQDDLKIPRLIGLLSAVTVIFNGGILVLARFAGQQLTITGWTPLWFALGLAGLLFHAAMDRDVQFRRVYGGFGALSLVLGVFLCLLPYEKVGDLFGPGFGLMSLALLFLMAFLRNEDDPQYRRVTQMGIGGAGLLFALVGMLGANLNAEFLVGTGHAPFGMLLAVLGLVYLCAAIGARGTDGGMVYLGGLIIGFLGLLIMLLAVIRSLWVPLISGNPESYFYPTGMLLVMLGALYSLIALLICSDNRLVVMTRRELSALFFSPIAYIVLLALTGIHWWTYLWFTIRLLPKFGMGMVIYPTMPEPIVINYILQWWTVTAILVVIPILTMRLLSEEKRTGTIEVLLTTPTSEVEVVLSKFLAALTMFLIFWIPFGLLLVGLRVIGGQEFEYRPLLAFSIVLAVTGAHFVAMGLFFSSVTRNQIIGGVLTFAGMLVLTMLFLAEREVTDPTLTAVIKHTSYLSLWIESLTGQLVPKYLLFHASMAFVWLFATVKVLEARKWT